MSSHHTFKIALVGDGGVGKTTFMQRNIVGGFTERYNPTIGVEVSSITFNTSDTSTITFDVWDLAGEEQFSGLRDGYTFGSHGLIFMFDTQSRASYKNISYHVKTVTSVCGNDVPMVLCGNKVDIAERKVKPMDVVVHRKLKCDYYDVSAKSSYNIQRPFLSLARRLLGEPDLEFV